MCVEYNIAFIEYMYMYRIDGFETYTQCISYVCVKVVKKGVKNKMKH